MDCKIAEKYKAEQNFDKAVSYYRDIMTRYEDGLYKPLLELKVFECIFDSGEYQTAIAEIDKFVTKNKAGNRELSQKAILMKGQCYIQSGEIEKALNEFNRIMTEYPELKQTPELVFFTGYCFMQQGKNDKAIEAFNSVIQNHPQSKYANNARLCIAQIRNKPDKTE
jgi:outer membrane protein assembly factor BamD (BamD/ComL family)